MDYLLQLATFAIAPDADLVPTIVDRELQVDEAVHQPHVVAEAPTVLRENGVEDRCQIVGGEVRREVGGA